VSRIQDNKLVNFTSGECRITILGENKTTGISSLYSTIIGIADEGISLPADTI